MGEGAVVYGNEKQMLDLQFVFKEADIRFGSQNPKDIFEFVKKGKKAILCRSQKPDISARLESGQYLWDDELIEALNFPLSRKSKNKRIVIWGTGDVCSYFEKEYHWQGYAALYGYVDSSKEKYGRKRNGLPVLSPKEISPADYYVIIAVNYVNYVEIKAMLKELGYTDGYVYYRVLLDDVAAYFRKTYESRECFSAVNCPNKDRSVRITSNGDVVTCCISYGSIYGNLFEQEFEEIWNSKRARISRLALENRTYVNCDKNRCPFLAGIKPNIRENAPVLWKYKENSGQYPDSVAPEVDRSCNLYCRSCRNSILVEDSHQIACFTNLVIEKLVHLPVRLIINTVGEPFASKYCRYIIYHEKTRKRGNISLYTNGTLLSPDVLDGLLEIYSSLEIAVSMDAATKNTYEKLRRNGNFDVLCRNLEYISKKRVGGE